MTYYIRRGELADRGWTRAMVARFLGKPDSVIETTGAGYRTRVHLYSLSRVLEVEQHDHKYRAWSSKRREAHHG